MATELKRFIIGRALKTEQAAHERLSKKTALAVLSSYALALPFGKVEYWNLPTGDHSIPIKSETGFNLA